LSGTIFNVQVNRERRRQGVGRALMQHVEAQLHAQGVPWAALQVGADNTPARNLYLGLGYRPYHHFFLCRDRGTGLWQQVAPSLSLLPVPRREGRRLYAHYAAVERNEGDAWAAAVVQADYDEGAPPGGRFWRCLLNEHEIGIAWLGGTLLLKPLFWRQGFVHIGLLRLLLDRWPGQYRQVNVQFGSSAHYGAALPILREIGFSPRERQHILMLKSLCAGENENA
jgi:GNAT superfamily N-acetyltransferase